MLSVNGATIYVHCHESSALAVFCFGMKCTLLRKFCSCCLLFWDVVFFHSCVATVVCSPTASIDQNELELELCGIIAQEVEGFRRPKWAQMKGNVAEMV